MEQGIAAYYESLVVRIGLYTDRQGTMSAVQRNMGKIVWGLTVGGIMAGLYMWATAIVPGGEMRYEHYLRLMMEQHGNGSILSLKD